MAAEAEMKNLNEAIKEQTEIIDGYTNDVNVYEENMALMADGTSESLNKVVENSIQQFTKQKVALDGTVTDQINTVKNSIDKQNKLYNIALKNQDNANATAYKNQIEADNEQLKELGIQLAKMTSSIETLTPEQIEAWKKIAKGSSSAYNEAIQYLPEDVQKKLNEVIGIVNNSTIPNEFGNLGSLSEIEFSVDTNNMIDDTDNLLYQIHKKIKDNTSVKRATTILADNANIGFNNNVNGSKWGSDLSSNISGGMTNPNSKKLITNAASKVAGWISEFLHHSTPDKGPLKEDDKWMPDMIDSMTKGITNNKIQVIKAAKNMAQDLNDILNMQQIYDFGILHGKLNNKIIDSTKTVFTTPNLTIYTQEFDAKKIANEVNKIFGSQY